MAKFKFIKCMNKKQTSRLSDCLYQCLDDMVKCTLCLFTGYYMYIEASRPRTRGQKARFLSPNLPSSNGECLTFYYNMNGRTMGTLNVYTQASGSLGSPVWTKSGNQGSKWQVAQVTLQSSSKFQVTCFFNCTVYRVIFTPC